jgi:hypothetical protein
LSNSEYLAIRDRARLIEKNPNFADVTVGSLFSDISEYEQFEAQLAALYDLTTSGLRAGTLSFQVANGATGSG